MGDKKYEIVSGRTKTEPALDVASIVSSAVPWVGSPVSNVLSGISFGRKLNRVQQFKKVKGAETKQLDAQYMPVPYNLELELYIMAKQETISISFELKNSYSIIFEGRRINLPNPKDLTKSELADQVL